MTKEKLFKWMEKEMDKIKKKYNDTLVGNDERVYWYGIARNDYHFPIIYHDVGDFPHYVQVDRFPSPGFLRALEKIEMSPQDYKFIKRLFRRFKKWLRQLYAEAKRNEKKILRELNSHSEAYDEYKSLKVAEILEKEVGK